MSGGLFEILEKIRVRPGMYLGSPSIAKLFIFLAGYTTARRELGIEPAESERNFYQNFQPWLQAYYNLSTVQSWAEVIALHCQDDRAAFEQFFVLLDQFRAVQEQLAVGEMAIA